MPSYLHWVASDSEGSDLELGGQLRRSRRRKHSFSSLGSWGRRMLRLRSNIRPAVVLLSALLVIAFLLAVLFYDGNHEIRGLSGYRSQFSENPDVYSHLRNLVMVAGHAVYTNVGCGEVEGEDSWFLESYQRHPGQASTFVDHIRAGVEEAAQDDKSLLLFSGGETRKEAGPRSEAQSYWGVAESKDWFGKSKQVRDRAITEEHARDSFENLLFSVCRFRELTGTYPLNITVVSYDFKEFRFANLHRSALRFPASRFAFRGTPSAASSIVAAQQGELEVQEFFQQDPYGCEGALQEKRLKRDPFLRTIPYPAGCPEISGLFSHCGTELFSKRLPWDDG